MNYIDDGQPSLKKSYCVFMDVLGFSDMISTSSGTEQEHDVFQRYYDVTSELITRLNQHVGDDSVLQMKIFSDNIVLALPWFSRDGESEFGFILMALREYQLSMALNGYFVRGGMSVEKLFVDNNMIYGKALLDAYALESKVANDPKIVISDEVLNIVRSHTQFYAHPQNSPQNSDVFIDADGKGFISYLDELIYQGEYEYQLDTERLLQHKERVIEAVDLHKNNTKVWYKYHWLCDYHNYFCSRVSDVSGYTNECMIPESVYKREMSSLV
ncbi:hypothetical protein ACPSLY_06970 [Vibrio parahaemolyticus]|uniref:hypothetical protein n=1 Tax=Vibrio parahaemolyticus TaxID=670 RepID=UPI0003A87E8D|nr:hypothetical protein [Vibrio parahaemolyticus]AYO04199.1 hypothetical protein D0871_07830 [Vibrio parahaemolyticus]EGQ9444901.1 hypothetical protein [Vibrio parahaemolyticus]EGR3370980.1 hypothetical protein [Vibrio parahaemolyticus]EHZ2907562.1 hypothetical protein [Vibrio parahaemolyticus]EIF2693318.1 hypothetical protein [Vibrio parahaemolyticus]